MLEFYYKSTANHDNEVEGIAGTERYVASGDSGSAPSCSRPSSGEGGGGSRAGCGSTAEETGETDVVEDGGNDCHSHRRAVAGNGCVRRGSEVAEAEGEEPLLSCFHLLVVDADGEGAGELGGAGEVDPQKGGIGGAVQVRERGGAEDGLEKASQERDSNETQKANTEGEEEEEEGGGEEEEEEDEDAWMKSDEPKDDKGPVMRLPPLSGPHLQVCRKNGRFPEHVVKMAWSCLGAGYGGEFRYLVVVCRGCLWCITLYLR